MSDLSIQSERDLDIRNLFFAILRKWRFILICSLLCAVIPSFFSGINGFRKVRNSPSLEQTNQQALVLKDNYENSLKNLSGESANITDQIQRQKDYKNRSYILNMDPTRVFKFAVTYNLNNTYTKADGTIATNNNVAAILNSYTSVVKNMEIDSSSLPSRADKDNSAPDSLNSLIVSVQDNSAKTLTLTVSGATAEDAEAFLSAVCETVEKNHDLIAKKLGEHTMIEVARKSHTDTDNNVNSIANTYTQNLNSLQATLNSVTKQLDALKEPTQKVYDRNSVIATVKTFAILGFVVGTFFSAFIVCVQYLTSDRITGVDEFTKHYPQLTILGSIPRRATTKIGRRLDQLINRMEDPSSENDSSLLHMAVAAKLEAVSEGKDLLLLGDTTHPEAPVLLESIQNLLSAKSITQIKSLNSGADAVRNARGKATVLLLSRDRETYRELFQEIEVLKLLGNEVLGVVLI